MKHFIVVFLLVGSMLLGSSYINISKANEITYAKCAIPKLDTTYKNAKAVFIGEVISEEKDGDKKIFEFKVKRFWKGIEDTKVKVAVYENFRFQAPYEVGKTFLVFANEDKEGGLIDGRCSRSKDIEGSSSELKDDLKKLGEGKTCINLSKEKEEKKKIKEKGE